MTAEMIVRKFFHGLPDFEVFPDGFLDEVRKFEVGGILTRDVVLHEFEDGSWILESESQGWWGYGSKDDKNLQD